MSIFGKTFILTAALSAAIWGPQVLAQEAPPPQGDAIEQDRSDDFYCRERRLGQWFYCVKPKPAEEIGSTAQVREESAVDRIAAIAKQLVRLERAWASRGGGGLPWHIFWQIYTC